MKTLQDKIKNLKCVNYNMYIGSGTESCDNCLCFEDALEELLGFISQEIQKAKSERDKEWNDKVCNLMGWEKNENYDRALLDLLEKQK